ncbi:hypothetical protein [Methanocaldococcus sp.]|uniref:hypothetical protein n=1 Tax=Methanocaldococcus sp. TaxID=2152917 RepID=UPI002637BB3C|nr:hypothetical protein [Methanocaldococcus sp.]MCQ6254129.1 hypothetical protein [Methanocaldococcus sp.]
MDDKKYILFLSFALILSSLLIYFLHFLIFRDIKHLLSYFLLHLAFVPIDVLIVTIVIERILEHRDKINKLKKLNMLIGAFFNTVGEDLLKIILKADKGNIKSILKISNEWDNKKYEKIKKLLKNYNYDIDIEKINLYELKNLLDKNKEFLLRLMENPLLLEHDEFSELLLAVFHLADELHKREDLNNLPKSDLNHLKNDIIRVYKFLVIQWLNYVKHLKDNYPYLYSIYLRSNPFNEGSVIVTENN